MRYFVQFARFSVNSVNTVNTVSTVSPISTDFTTFNKITNLQNLHLMYLAHLQVDFRAFLSLVPGSPAASAATLSSPTSCPISCTCSCPSTHSTSLLYTTKPSFEETTSTGPPESSYHVSYNEEQGNGHSQSNQLAGQAYQQQPTNTVVSNPTLGSGTLFYKRPQEESQETTVAPEVTPYIQSNPSYSKPFTSFSTSSPAPTSASPPSFPPQVKLSFAFYDP